MTLTPYLPTAPIVDGIALLEASAGTGKTYSIADLYVRLVAERDLEVGAILVVTFTKAATAELRDRIRRRLGDALQAVENAQVDQSYLPTSEVLAHVVALGRRTDTLSPLARRLLAARESFDEAAVYTIHGFCQRMLQHNAFESGVDFDLELLANVKELLSEAVDDFLVRELHAAPPGLVRFLHGEGIHRQRLKDLGRLVVEHPGLVIEPAAWQQLSSAVFATWTKAVEPVATQWLEHSAELVEALVLATERKILNGRSYPARKTIANALILSQWFQEGAPPTAKRLAILHYFTPHGLRVACNKGKDPPDHPLLATLGDLHTQSLAARALADGLLPRFCQWLRAELEVRKKARRVQTYTDLLGNLDAGLRGPAGPSLRRTICAQYQAALIDEFQDTDPVQWGIFHSLFGLLPGAPGETGEVLGPRAPLYLIGDPKQAIYSFRGADLHTYLEARDVAVAGRRTLTTNWRSDQPMVAAVQHLFAGPLPFADARITCPEIAAAHLGTRCQPEGPALTVRFLTAARLRHTLGQTGADPQGLPSQNTEILNLEETHKALLQHMAQDLVKFLQSATTVPSQDGPRRVQPGDLAVLVRTNWQAHDVQKALAKVGLPSVTSSAGDVFQSATAAELAWVLAAILKPGDTGALSAALATALLGLDAGTIASLDTDDHLRERWSDRLRTWQKLWQDKGLMWMLRALLADAVAVDPLAEMPSEVSIPERLLTLPEGERRLTDLLHLTELAHAAAIRGALQPAGVLAWLAHERAADTDEAREQRLETDAAAVQIVTIHKAKGLQYPFVWCPFAWAGPVAIDAKMLRFHDPDNHARLTLDLRLDSDDPAKLRHHVLADLEGHAESLRLLYVALTRAEHRTVVYAGRLPNYGASALAWLLHRHLIASQVPEQTAQALQEGVLAWVKETDEVELLAHMRAVLQPCAATCVSLVEAIEQLTWQDRLAVTPVLSTRQFPPRRLDAWWRRASYTALIRGGRQEDERAARRQLENADQVGMRSELLPELEHTPKPDTFEPMRALAPADAQDVPLADFSRGKDAGNFLHKIMELHDFTRPSTDPALAKLVQTQARQHSMALDEAGRVRLVAGLELVLDTPLGEATEGLRLRDIGLKQRLNELDFDLPLVGADEGEDDAHGVGPSLAHVTSRQLAAVLRKTRAADSPLTDAYLERVVTLDFFPPLRGFLSGSIDLVFTADVQGVKRWFLADYKSNWLGDSQGAERRCTRWHYRLESMQAAMEHAHYFLQYHLYVVALHRWLSWRLRGYDYDTHFGGCLYLFVRGMTGPDNESTGVFFDRPSRALVEGLSHLLSSGGPR